ncbi:hypothetical protein [Companilactobacillus furfuricola]|uniref:hypothetical protein n=1 Tax=Companilactobacillus furfuricola TaxID=1462575 RepID=UPI0013DE06FB|nr:hypothetical protein [Companilactobacillus furfuricola]
MKKKIALKQFEAKWNQMMITTYLLHKGCHVTFTSNKINFEYGSSFTESLDLPKTLNLTIKGDTNVTNEAVTKPITIKFFTDGRNSKHFYTVQMNWGVLVAKNP